jgi:hypothetical protein
MRQVAIAKKNVAKSLASNEQAIEYCTPFVYIIPYWEEQHFNLWIIEEEDEVPNIETWVAHSVKQVQMYDSLGRSKISGTSTKFLTDGLQYDASEVVWVETRKQSNGYSCGLHVINNLINAVCPRNDRGCRMTRNELIYNIRDGDDVDWTTNCIETPTTNEQAHNELKFVEEDQQPMKDNIRDGDGVDCTANCMETPTTPTTNVQAVIDAALASPSESPLFVPACRFGGSQGESIHDQLNEGQAVRKQVVNISPEHSTQEVPSPELFSQPYRRTTCTTPERELENRASFKGGEQAEENINQCQALTLKGARCKKRLGNLYPYCAFHMRSLQGPCKD